MGDRRRALTAKHSTRWPQSYARATRPGGSAALGEVPEPLDGVVAGICGSDAAAVVNDAERECAQILDWYAVPSEYEPTVVRSRAQRRGGQRDQSAFTPDFYLPDQDLYIEVTVMKQSLVTRKNRKLREVRRGSTPQDPREALLPPRHRAPRARRSAADRLVSGSGAVERLRDEGSPSATSTSAATDRTRVTELGAEIAEATRGGCPCSWRR